MRGRKLSLVVLSASLAVAMAACGNDDKTTTTSGAQTATTATTAAAAAAATTPTTAAPKPTVATASTSLGTVFVDATGKTLYVFDRDTSPTSTCTGTCAATWPALVLPAGATAPVAGTGVTNLTVAARPDDATKMQVVWNGRPLYNYAADTAPGDTKGDGVGGVWHAAKPA
jgi:predicted lipoprotein with Yx(FWY)xxD motif